MLLDDRLTGVTGLDLVLLTRADPVLQGVVPVLVGDDSQGGDAERAHLASHGIAHLLARPVETGVLLDLLAGILGNMAPPPRPLCAPASPPRGAGLTILVAEDNLINQQVAVGLLEKLGHRADVADDGRAALEMVQARPYDLVLMDMQMPGMSGLDATQAIRALDHPAKALPIIAMTANAMSGDRDLCLAAGMNDYISKPIDRAKLAALLGRWQSKLKEGVVNL